MEKQFKHARRRKKNAMATQNQLIEERYIPALRYRLLTPLYDPVLKFVMREETFKHRLVERVQLLPGQHVLDHGFAEQRDERFVRAHARTLPACDDGYREVGHGFSLENKKRFTTEDTESTEILKEKERKKHMNRRDAVDAESFKEKEKISFV